MHHVSPEPVSHLSQHLLLPMLLRCATAPGSAGDVCFGHAVEALRSTEDGRVSLALRNGEVRSMPGTIA